MQNIQQNIIIVRHGETDWNLKGKYQGRENTEINENGKEQCKQNARWIKELLQKENIKKIKCRTSPLKRAQQSLEVIINTSGIVVEETEIVEEFAELNVGHWQGMTTLEVKEQFYQERKNRKKDKWRFKPENGESLENREKGVVEQLERISEPSLIVTHAGIARIIMHYLGGMDTTKAAEFDMPHLGGLVWRHGKLDIFNP